ncbi:MAG: hypothetical protein IZT57_01320 [Chloroflexi bacterium]|nr:hypothetical protein [Chloroflexota bacterium]
MAKELGRIDKPPADRYRSKKKLYVVPLYISSPKMGPDYADKCQRYWGQVEEQLSNLEDKIGYISKVFHEAVADSGKVGLDIMLQISPDSHRISSARLERGASLEKTEDKELVLESTDWERIFMVGFTSQKVAGIVTDAYISATRSRYESIVKAIAESLKEGEAGVLFVREGHMIQFPEDIEVFSVSPPALDELTRWLRERTEQMRGAPPEQKKAPETEEKVLPKKKALQKKAKGKSKKSKES